MGLVDILDKCERNPLVLMTPLFGDYLIHRRISRYRKEANGDLNKIRRANFNEGFLYVCSLMEYSVIAYAVLSYK